MMTMDKKKGADKAPESQELPLTVFPSELFPDGK